MKQNKPNESIRYLTSILTTEKYNSKRLFQIKTCEMFNLWSQLDKETKTSALGAFKTGLHTSGLQSSLLDCDYF